MHVRVYVLEIMVCSMRTYARTIEFEEQVTYTKCPRAYACQHQIVSEPPGWLLSAVVQCKH